MALALAHIVFDCEAPPRVAAFWSGVMGRPVDPGASEFFASIGRSDVEPAWFFIKVPEPRVGKNRIHVDLRTEDRQAEVARLQSLGAEVVAEHDEWGTSWTVLYDVEGNQFCVAGKPAGDG